MGTTFANGQKAFGFCDVCGFRTRLPKLRALVVKRVVTQTLACRACWVPDHPQLMLGTFPVYDPQALRNPRPDGTYIASGTNVLGNQSGGSRDIQWGWNPVGGARSTVSGIAPNALVTRCLIGTVTVEVT